ncbi:MAG: autotransporter outer membrane beta-barrel domain-containing protein [Rhodocyclaceae bacterium]|nr:autotransporter outer membrane beta-barrel domain-containing protein [Rhodocyclaceae bacterium]
MNKVRSKTNRFRPIAVALGIFGVGAVHAQVPSPSPAAGVLTGVPGLNEVQTAAARVTETICPFLGTPDPLGSPQARLSDTCTRLVVSALEDGSALDMGLTSAELATALQAVAPEEMNAAGRIAVEGSLSNPVNGRLLALRSGGRGMLLAGSGLTIDGNSLALARLLPAGSRGGSAGEGEFGGRWGGFINANYNSGDRDASRNEDAFDFSDAGLTAGIDYRFTDALVGGVALSWSKTDADFDADLGTVESDNFGVSLYVSYATPTWYVDGRLGVSRIDFDTERRILVVSNTPAEAIDTTAFGSTDGDQVSFNAGGGYNFEVASMTVTPYGRLDYLKLDVDGFTEREDKEGMGLVIGDHDTESLQSAIGARVARTYSTGGGVFTPYAGIEWNHEFDNDKKSLVARYANDPFNESFTITSDDPDRDYFTLSLGASAVFPHGLAAFVNVDTALGLAETRSYALTLGGRLEF